MLKRLTLLALALLLLAPATARAQTMMESMKGLHDTTVAQIMATAEMVDESLYAYRPTEEVRSLGQILAHIANAQYFFCAAAGGGAPPIQENLEETRTTKAEIIDALQGAFAYCDGVYEATTDDMAGKQVEFFTGPNTVAGVLAFNSAHNYEHYGNLVTYMRINGITPPSSM